MSGFDLDGFIDETVEVFAQKHPVEGRTDQGSKGRIVRAFNRAGKDHQTAERLTRRLGPKLAIKGDPNDG